MRRVVRVESESDVEVLDVSWIQRKAYVGEEVRSKVMVWYAERL